MGRRWATWSTHAPMAAARPRPAVGKPSPWISQPDPPTPIANEVMKNEKPTMTTTVFGMPVRNATPAAASRMNTVMQAPWIPAPLRGKRRINAQVDAPENSATFFRPGVDLKPRRSTRGRRGSAVEITARPDRSPSGAPATSGRSRIMRYLGYTLGDPSAPLAPPTPELMEEMGKFVEEATKAGVLLATSGLCPYSRGPMVMPPRREVHTADEALHHG